MRLNNVSKINKVTYNNNNIVLDKLTDYDLLILQNHSCCTKEIYFNDAVFVWCGETICNEIIHVKHILKASYDEWEKLDIFNESKPQPILFESFNPFVKGMFKAMVDDPIILHKCVLTETDDMSQFVDEDIPFFSDVIVDGHKCVMRCGGAAPYEYTWCGESECKQHIFDNIDEPFFNV